MSLKNAEVNGAMGWLLDGQPYVPVLAQSGLATAAKSAFFDVGCAMYTTWEHGPQMSLVWKEEGSYDWAEVDSYLGKLAANDSKGRIQFRFCFDAPEWWMKKNPGEMVHVQSKNGETKSTAVVSFASQLYWDEAEKAARALVRYCDTHPEGWRFVGVLYHGGICEWFPHWGEGYSDYSPAFRAGFREWSGGLELPTPAERLRGDFFDFYDPAKGTNRQKFCEYSSEIVTRLIERLARAFKEESKGRIFTRTPAGYQPMFDGFRYHAGPHADFASVLKCPWLDSFFMPHDYRCRGHGGHHGFELPVASVHLNGKTYISEVDDRTHRTDPPQYGSTDNVWQTAQVLKRAVGAALCQGAGAEFKDWGRGWYEDAETMPVIKRLNQLAQESVQHDRSPIAEIAVIINPRSTCHIRDDSPIYWTLNHQQMHLCYPRIGAPHDRLLVDDLDKAREYKLYIVQDALYLTDAQRRLIREKVCARGHTVLWFYAPGIVGERGLSVDAVSELIGMPLKYRVSSDPTYLARPYLRLLTNDVPAGIPLFTFEALSPLFYVDDPQATTLGLGGYYFDVLRPAFVSKKMNDWTSIYCSVPVLPPTVIRKIARQAGVHIYADGDDFVAANNWLVTLSAATAGVRTIRLPGKRTVLDAMTQQPVATGVEEFAVDLEFGETALWTIQSE